MADFKLMVCGSRTITDRELIFKWIDNEVSIHKDDRIIIIEGEARGVDSIAKDYALINHLEVLSFPADWKKYGRRAGMIRNEEMVKACDDCLIIWDGESHGTKNDIELCKKYYKCYRVIVPGKIGCSFCSNLMTFVNKEDLDQSQQECYMRTYANIKCNNFDCYSYADKIEPIIL